MMSIHNHDLYLNRLHMQICKLLFHSFKTDTDMDKFKAIALTMVEICLQGNVQKCPLKAIIWFNYR